MKIFFVPSGYPNELYPFANSFLKEQVDALSKANHEIIVLNVAQKSFKKLAVKTDKRISVTQNENITEYKCWIYTFRQEKYPNIYVDKCEKALKKLFSLALHEHGKPDVVYAHFGFYAGYVMGKLCHAHGIPLVVQEHYSYLMGDNLSSKILQYEKSAIINSNLFCCVSNNLRKSLLQNIQLESKEKEKLLVLENMLNSNFSYHPLVKKDKFIFLSVGNLNSRKNFGLLIEAFCMVFDKSDNVELRIGGTGEEEYNLHQLVKQKDRESQVVFLGLLTREDVYNENVNCNCFALMSKRETFGIVYREALAIGRPIITSVHGGFDEDLSPLDGIQVNSFDVRDVATAMKNMRDNYDTYKLCEISKRCLSKYSESVVIKQIETALQAARIMKETDKL